MSILASFRFLLSRPQRTAAVRRQWWWSFSDRGGSGDFPSPQPQPFLSQSTMAATAEKKVGRKGNGGNDDIYRFERSWLGENVLHVAVFGTKEDNNDERLSLSYADVLARWRDDPRFAIQFSKVLAEAPFPSFVWEVPPTNLSLIKNIPFHFVLIAAPHLARNTADLSAFREHLSPASSEKEKDSRGDDRCAPYDAARAFLNLGGDATLIAPCEWVDGNGNNNNNNDDGDDDDDGAGKNCDAEVVDNEDEETSSRSSLSSSNTSPYGHLAAFVRQAPGAQKVLFWKVVADSVMEVLQWTNDEIWLR